MYSKHMMNHLAGRGVHMKKFKICIVGCGFMTKEGHGPSCAKYASEHEDVELAACCDINLAAAQEICNRFGFARAYTDYLEMAERESRTPCWS